VETFTLEQDDGTQSSYSWVLEQEAPDVIAVLRIAVQAQEQADWSRPTPPQPQDAVEELIAWLNSDSLDWDAVERGDAWTD